MEALVTYYYLLIFMCMRAKESWERAREAKQQSLCHAGSLKKYDRLYQAFPIHLLHPM